MIKQNCFQNKFERGNKLILVMFCNEKKTLNNRNQHDDGTLKDEFKILGIILKNPQMMKVQFGFQGQIQARAKTSFRINLSKTSSIIQMFSIQSYKPISTPFSRVLYCCIELSDGQKIEQQFFIY
ncbi:unnamed protein product [Paramecium octaurelia]|uniref:Uncharacterized protein n=1 Tax=Paramecium octaurelia TaxID=43137 RepID=A0A8S1X343_PAROT|nr:unnamed protein product [Paramecium octaurelia]